MYRYLLTIFRNHANTVTGVMTVTSQSTGEVRAAIEREFPDAECITLERTREPKPTGWLRC